MRLLMLGRKAQGALPQLWVGGTLTAIVLITALVAGFWTPYPADQQSIIDRLQGPSMAHWLGTDLYGRDILSRIMGGPRRPCGSGWRQLGLDWRGGCPWVWLPR